MNFLGRIFGLGTSGFGSRGSTSDQDDTALGLASIPSGQLFLVKSERSERIFNHAVAVVKKAPSTEHDFHLLISPIKEGCTDGQARVFLICKSLEFRVDVDIIDGLSILVWTDPLSSSQTYQFVTTYVQSRMIESFEQCIHQAMYEQKHRRRFLQASSDDLEEFVVKRTARAQQTTLQTTACVSSTSDAAGGSANESLSKISSIIIIYKTAELYLWEKDAGHFLKQADIIGSIRARSSQYYITATTKEGQQLLSHKISSELFVRWSIRLLSLTWEFTSRSGYSSSWCIKFESLDDFRETQDVFLNCLCGDGTNRVTRKPALVGEQEMDDLNWSIQNIVEQDDAESDGGDGDDGDDTLSTSGEVGSAPEDEDEDAAPRGSKHTQAGEHNSQLAVGHSEQNNRSFVIRGEKIGVFCHPDKGKVEYVATIKDLGFKGMKGFKPKHMMLHENDKKMVLLNPFRESSLFSMDVEYGKIVEEWKVKDDITIKTIAPTSKYAQLSGEQTLVGITGSALFRIDPRSGRRGGNVMMESRQYATQSKFSSIATTTNSYLAVASDKGDIRLFDSVGKNAKSTLPAMGDPIIGMDVTGDGRWIVGTCKTFLFVIDTLVCDGKYAGSLGFERAFPAQVKPQPRRLQLRPDHAALMDHNISFTAAKFNMGEGQEENAIVTSTGRYVVAFDFSKIKENKPDSYVIKRYDNEVVQDNFKFGDANEIIVALTDNVLSLNKRQLAGKKVVL